MPPASEAERRVERARPADAPALAGLAAAALLDPWSAAGFAEEIVREQSRVWVVRGSREEVLGYLAAQHVADELHVLSLVVTPAARRSGIGRALLAHAVASARGARSAHLEVRADDDGARAFYERLGFRPSGRRPGFYSGGIDAIRMDAQLGSAS